MHCFLNHKKIKARKLRVHLRNREAGEKAHITEDQSTRNRKQSDQTDPNKAQVLKSLRNCPLTKVFMPPTSILGNKNWEKKRSKPEEDKLPF